MKLAAVVHRQTIGGQRLPRTCMAIRLPGAPRQDAPGAAPAAESRVYKKEAPHTLRQWHLDNRPLHANDTKAISVRPAVREQYAPLTKAPAAVLNRRSGLHFHHMPAPARGRPQAPPSLKHCRLHDHLHHGGRSTERIRPKHTCGPGPPDHTSTYASHGETTGQGLRGVGSSGLCTAGFAGASTRHAERRLCRAP